MTQPEAKSPQPKAMFNAAEIANDDSFTGADWALFLSVSLIWGSSFLLIAEALEGLTPGAITLGRVGIGAITLIGIRALRDGSKRIEREDYGRVFLLSVLWVGVPFTLFPLAQEHINSAITGLLNGATPVFAGLVSLLLVKVAPNKMQVIGIAVGFVGGVRASFITYLIPVVSLALGVVFRDDAVTALAIVGAVITVGGAFAASQAKEQPG